MKNQTICSVILGTLLLAYPASAQEPYTYEGPIDVQCPAAVAAPECPTGLLPGQTAAQTGLRGISPRGDIVGFYVAVAGDRQRGFLLQDGRYITIDVPVPGVRATLANGINARGEIVGQYTLPVHDLNHPPPEDSPLYCPSAADPACIKAFYYWRGNFTTLMFPETVDEDGHAHTHPGAIAQRITAEGDIYGCLHDHDLGMSMFGAVWTRSGTMSLLFNGGQTSDGKPVAMSMNNGGARGGKTVAGLFVEMMDLNKMNQTRGYRVRNGAFDAYDATPSANLTAIWDMNTGQQLVGVFREASDPMTKRHGFLQRPDEPASITLDFRCEKPLGCGGAIFGAVAFSTSAFGINPDGVVVGQYQLVNGGAIHGFIAFPIDTN